MVRSQILVSEVTILRYNPLFSLGKSTMILCQLRPVHWSRTCFHSWVLGRDGDPAPSVVGGDVQAEDENDVLFVNHRSISEVIADAPRESAAVHTTATQENAAPIITAPQNNAAPIVTAPKKKTAPIVATPEKNVASVPTAPQKNTANLDDADLGPGVKRKQNRRKPLQGLVAGLMGAVGGAHAIRTFGPTCKPSPEKSGAVADPGKSLAEQQRVAIHAKYDRFVQRVKAKIEVMN